MFQNLFKYIKNFLPDDIFRSAANILAHVPSQTGFTVVQAKNPQIKIHEIYADFETAQDQALFISDVYAEDFYVVKIKISLVTE